VASLVAIPEHPLSTSSGEKRSLLLDRRKEIWGQLTNEKHAYPGTLVCMVQLYAYRVPVTGVPVTGVPVTGVPGTIVQSPFSKICICIQFQQTQKLGTRVPGTVTIVLGTKLYVGYPVPVPRNKTVTIVVLSLKHRCLPSSMHTIDGERFVDDKHLCLRKHPSV
jgi:hypothetical protein